VVGHRDLCRRTAAVERPAQCDESGGVPHYGREAREIECADPGILADLDRPEEYRQNLAGR
jgi:hypothetical protein